jgi:hypothetical protein
MEAKSLEELDWSFNAQVPKTFDLTLREVTTYPQEVRHIYQITFLSTISLYGARFCLTAI